MCRRRVKLAILVADLKAQKERQRLEAEIFLASRPQIGAFRIVENPDAAVSTVIRAVKQNDMENSGPVPRKPKHGKIDKDKLDYRSYQNSRDNSTEKSRGTGSNTRHKIIKTNMQSSKQMAHYGEQMKKWMVNNRKL